MAIVAKNILNEIGFTASRNSQAGQTTIQGEARDSKQFCGSRTVSSRFF
jgi:hypothetical protein